MHVDGGQTGHDGRGGGQIASGKMRAGSGLGQVTLGGSVLFAHVNAIKVVFQATFSNAPFC